jgi:hypothetical protein
MMRAGRLDAELHMHMQAVRDSMVSGIELVGVCVFQAGDALLTSEVGLRRLRAGLEGAGGSMCTQHAMLVLSTSTRDGAIQAYEIPRDAVAGKTNAVNVTSLSMHAAAVQVPTDGKTKKKKKGNGKGKSKKQKREEEARTLITSHGIYAFEATVSVPQGYFSAAHARAAPVCAGGVLVSREDKGVNSFLSERNRSECVGAASRRLGLQANGPINQLEVRLRQWEPVTDVHTAAVDVSDVDDDEGEETGTEKRLAALSARGAEWGAVDVRVRVLVHAQQPVAVVVEGVVCDIQRALAARGPGQGKPPRRFLEWTLSEDHGIACCVWPRQVPHDVAGGDSFLGGSSEICNVKSSEVLAAARLNASDKVASTDSKAAELPVAAAVSSSLIPPVGSSVDAQPQPQQDGLKAMMLPILIAGVAVWMWWQLQQDNHSIYSVR